MKRKTRLLSLTLAVLMVALTIPFNLLPVSAEDAADYKAHSEYNSSTGDVFLGGKYIEIGVSRHGSFGTYTSPKSSGFHTSGKSLGMIVDNDGWDSGKSPTTGDFFLPGSPEERYILAYYYNGVKYEFPVADRISTNVYN